MLTTMTLFSYRYNSKELVSLKELFSCFTLYSLLNSCLLTEQNNKIFKILFTFKFT